MPSPNHYLFTS